MKFKDSDQDFLNRCFKAADAARMADRKKCREFMAYLKDRLKSVTAEQIKTHFILKDLDEATTWYKIFIYSGLDNHQRDPRLEAMFSIVAKYIAQNASAQQKRKIMKDFIQEGFHFNNY